MTGISTRPTPLWVGRETSSPPLSGPSPSFEELLGSVVDSNLAMLFGSSAPGTRRTETEPPDLTTLGFPEPHPAQQRVLSERKRFNVMNFGRRGGKTALAERLLAETARDGYPACYICPTYKMLAQVWRDLAALVPATKTLASEHRIEWGDGSIDMWSGDDAANAIRGRKYKRIIIDEAALIPALMDAWERSVRPTLTDMRGDAWFISTPRRGGAFEELFRRGQGDDPHWMSWQMPSSVNPFLDPAELEEARATMSDDAFRQEYLAEFEAAESDLVFPEFYRDTHVKPAPCRWEETKWRIAGVDLGGGDPTAIVPLGVSKDERVHQFGEFYRRGDVALDDLTDYLFDWHHRAPFTAIVVDPSAKAIPESLRRLGLPVYPANNARGEGFEAVRFWLQSGRFTIEPTATNSIAEFAGYRWAKRRDGESGERYATSTPVDHHADAMDARRYALMALQEGVMKQATIQRAAYRPRSYAGTGARHG